MVLVLLSASVDRVGVSRMWDFFYNKTRSSDMYFDSNMITCASIGLRFNITDKGNEVLPPGRAEDYWL